MVLVSNEWLTNKDDDQKPNPASPPLAPGEAGVASLSNGGMTSTSTESSKTTRPTDGVGVESTVKRKKAQQTANVETAKNIEQEQLFHKMERDSNNEEAIENQENNNMQVCDSNTNTLQSVSSPDHSSTVHMEVPQQVLHITMNSVQHANIAGVGMGVTTSDNLYSSLGLLNKNVLQRESTMDCGTLMVGPVAPTVSVDLSMGSESASVICTGDAKIVLQCEPKSHKFETRSILLQPNQDCKVGRLIAKSKASEGNAIFDCKVLSRNHAILWYTPDGRFWVKDTKSSNGTFINDNKLGNDPAELHYGDTVKFGVEVIENSRQEVHGCIIARVTLFLPDGREAISIEADEILTGPNRISFDEVQRLNSFLQEAAQREKTLKAKLSSLQGILDSTRKNSAMCWQSMISEDQLLHKISLLEKKLQMMEKNVPENALRNEVVKLLEDKTTYQLTAKEALRKVYQERCDAMQMLSKMELAYATSENECGILRAQMVTSKQTLQDFNARLEQLQQEYIEYKQESLRQQQEAKEREEHSLELLKEKISLQYGELEKLRLQVSHLQKSIVEYDSEQKLEEQNVLKQLDAIIPDDDEYEKEIESVDEDLTGGPQDDMRGIDQQSEDSEEQKMNKKLNLSEIDLKKVIRKSSVIKLLKNSDLTKGEDGSAVLRAIFDDDEDSESELKEVKENLDAQASDVATELSMGISNQLVHNFPRYIVPNGIAEPFVDPAAGCSSAYKIESQKTLVHAGEYLYIPPELPTEQAIEMLQEECDTYKEKTERLTGEIHCMQEQIKLLQEQLEQEIEHNAIAKLQKNRIKSSEQRQTSGQEHGQDSTENAWNEDIVAINNLQMEREEELIVYKERLENSESSNKQLRDEISHLKQQHTPPGNQLLLHRVLPLGCIALAVLIYLISNRI